MKIEAIKTRRLYLRVADQLLQLMAEGTLKPGDRLPSERDLATSFGVSRPTLREALIALELAGSVEIRSGSGVYVTQAKLAQLPELPDSGAGPFEILQARLCVEAETAALAAEEIDEVLLVELENSLREMERENQRDDNGESADQQFHEIIARASGNGVLEATVSWLWQLRMQSEISTLFHRRVRAEGIKPILADHEAIVNAIRQRDAEGARQAMTDHLQRVIDSLIDGNTPPDDT